MENDYLVSIITPVYNCEKHIANTIENVLAQTYKNLEMILVDDCSNDKSASIIKKYVEQDMLLGLYETQIAQKPRDIGI